MKKRFLTLYNYNIPYSYRPLSYVRHGYCIGYPWSLHDRLQGSLLHGGTICGRGGHLQHRGWPGGLSVASIRGQEGPPMTTKIAIIWFGRTDSGGSSLA